MKLSIITINRNNRDGLQKTLDSVARQDADRSLFEYIVVDGASTDGSAQCIESYDSHIDRWVSEPDSGIYNAMNKAVRMSTGEYLLFLNSGDCLYDGHVVASVLPYLHDSGIVFGEMHLINTGEIYTAPPDLTLLSLCNTSLPHNASFISREAMERRPYDEKYSISSDWKFWVEALILDNVSYSFYPGVVTSYDCDGISSRNRTWSQIERDKILHDVLPERILTDYLHLTKGEVYQDTPYDMFYSQLRDTRYGRVLYRTNRFIMKVASRLFESARFMKELE